MTRYAQHFSTLLTPQTEKAHPAQGRNDAGGYGFVIDCWTRLDRWLILGAEGGTYYASERKLVRENAVSLQECLNTDGVRTVNRIVEISNAGRASKNDAAIFALAMAAGHSCSATRQAAFAAMPKVCRVGTHLFDFLTSVQGFRGWGRGLRRAVANWYLEKDANKLGLQVTKYRQRNGWTHRDVLRKCGGEIDAESEQQAILRWVVKGLDGMGARAVDRNGIVKEYAALDSASLPRIIQGYEAIKGVENPRSAAKLVSEYRLTHEMVPSDMLKHAVVWEALLESMPMNAMIRNLGRLTSLGLLDPFSEGQKKVTGLLRNLEAIKKARVHPIALLKAMRVYRQGRAEKGKLTWDPNQENMKALEDGFYLSFDALEPTGKNVLLANDVSGSMSWPQNNVSGLSNMSSREAAVAMSMVTARVEPNHHIQAFSHTLVPVDITSTDRLTDAMNKFDRIPMGGTDCSLPIQWALNGKIPVDVFHMYTDEQTWAGNGHPHQWLERYRQKIGRDAKLICVCFGSSKCTIANPDDVGSLNIAGFDTSAPSIMADFAREGFGQ